jgi:hypothetical protein
MKFHRGFFNFFPENDMLITVLFWAAEVVNGPKRTIILYPLFLPSDRFLSAGSFKTGKT